MIGIIIALIITQAYSTSTDRPCECSSPDETSIIVKCSCEHIDNSYCPVATINKDKDPIPFCECNFGYLDMSCSINIIPIIVIPIVSLIIIATVSIVMVKCLCPHDGEYPLVYKMQIVP